MSAQILLSMLAPALPAAPQGSAATVAGEFEGLLAGLAGSPRAANDAGSPEASADAEVQVEDDELPASGFLVPSPAAQPAPPPVAPVASASPPAEAAPVAIPPSGAPLPAPVADGSAPVPSAAPPAAVAVPGLSPAAPTTPISTGPADEAAASVPAAASVSADGEAPAAPPPPPSAPPAPISATAAAGAPPPPPLRPAVERASRPLDAAGREAALAEGASTTPDSSRPAATGAAPAAVAATKDRPPVPAPDAVPAPAMDAGGEAPAESGPAPDSAPAPEAAAAPARETSPTVLSRAALEATAQITAQILRKLDGRTTRFEMALLPEELGRVDVKLDIDSEGRLAARLAFDNPAAATDLRGRADELRRQLEQAGFHLAEDAFEFAERDSGSSAFDRGDDARHGSGRAFAAASRLNAETDAVPAPRWTALSLAPAGVDLKV